MLRCLTQHVQYDIICLNVMIMTHNDTRSVLGLPLIVRASIFLINVFWYTYLPTLEVPNLFCVAWFLKYS